MNERLLSGSGKGCVDDREWVFAAEGCYVAFVLNADIRSRSGRAREIRAHLVVFDTSCKVAA